MSTITVGKQIWHRIHQILIESRENSIELLNEHINNYGVETKKNKYIAEMYEREIKEISSLLDYTSNNNGVPF